MINTILFPCEPFSIKKVDPDFQKEYDAVLENGGFEIYFYDYDQFVRDGTLKLNRQPEVETPTILRGWMLNDTQYKKFYDLLLERNIRLITNEEQYCTMHLFPSIYPILKEDTPGILVFPNGTDVDIDKIKTKFKRFMIKDYVKSEKGTDIPKSFDSSISKDEFSHWISVFKDYRGKLFTRGICIKEFVDLKKYGDRTNEWRVFYMCGNIISVSRNSGQMDFILEPPKMLIEKYRNLPSPFYTIDYAELADGTWKILEAGDGQVSGLSDNQNANAFFKALKMGL